MSLAGAATSIFFVATKRVLSQQHICCDKHIFVMGKDGFCRDKIMLVVTNICHNKHMFVVTSIIFVMTNMHLS